MSNRDLRDLPNLSIHQLLYVREAARAATWTDAAHRLGVSQPALSQGVAEVERRLGIALFERRSRARIPTPALALVLEVADRIIAATDDLDQRLHELETGQRGHLRVGMIDTAALGMFAAALATFRTSHPDVTTTLVVDSSTPLSQGVASGELDLAIVVSPNPILLRTPTSFRTEPLVAEEMYVYPPFGLPKSSVGWEPERWGPWVTYPTGSQSRELIERALLTKGSSIVAVAESSNPDVLRQMVRLGVGWCVLPKNIAQAGNDPLKPLKGPPLTNRSMALIRRSNALFNSAADELAQLLNHASTDFH
jgi:DNA-binding transcriptional LysR family regulator